MEGFVHSICSMSTVDGPGVRFVVFMQGCPLRCSCCHNPDTWETGVGKRFTPQQLFDKIQACKPYFGDNGGVTVSGGEPLLQAPFVSELFALCQQAGIHTVLDTSGCVVDEVVKKLLTRTDMVLLDMKMPTNELYLQHVGCSMAAPLAFLEMLEQMRIATWLRQVSILGINDTPHSMNHLKQLKNRHRCVKKIELLPFVKLCASKYEDRHIPFLFAHIPKTPDTTIQVLYDLLHEEINQ